MALEIVRRARANGMRFDWTAADSTYGQDRALLRALDDAEKTFVVDVHRDQRVFLEESPAVLPGKPSAETPASLRVDEWSERAPAAVWQTLWVRHTTRGELRVEALHARVWATLSDT